MSLSTAVDFANQFASPKQQKATVARPSSRDYAVGSAGYPVGYDSYGADPAEYAPEFFGNYLLTSNLVYAVVTQRASWLASLPLRLYKYKDGSTSKLPLPRGSGAEDMLRSILESMNRAGKSHDNKRNAVAALHAIRSQAQLYYSLRGMGMEEVFDGLAYDLIQYVNPFWTCNRLVRMISMCLDIWGQSYIFVERGGSGKGQPKEMWWAKPTQVKVVVDPKNYIKEYLYTPLGGGDEIHFRPSETIRIYYPNPLDEFQPLPPLASARIYADHELASMQSNIRLHEQGSHPGAIVMPGTEDEEWEETQAREIEVDINNRLGGVDKAHRWGVFRKQVKIDRMGITPKDAEYISGMAYDAEAIARTYDWPIDLLSGKRTYENVEQAFRRAWQSVMINGAFIAAELAEQLLPMFSNPGADVPMFDGSAVAVLQESEKMRWEIEKDQINLTITVNEWRSSRGLPAVEGGDQLFVSNQLTPLDSPVFVTNQPGFSPTPINGETAIPSDKKPINDPSMIDQGKKNGKVPRDLLKEEMLAK